MSLLSLGHRSLWIEKGILHRDISANNILLGQDLSDIGNRGVLIDFDMSIRINLKNGGGLNMPNFNLVSSITALKGVFSDTDKNAALGNTRVPVDERAREL